MTNTGILEIVLVTLYIRFSAVTRSATTEPLKHPPQFHGSSARALEVRWRRDLGLNSLP